MIGRALAVAAVTAGVIAAGAPAAGGPSGTYTEKIAGATPPVLNGTWSVTLKPSSFTIRKGGALAVVGTLVVSKGRLQFTDTGGPFRCLGATAKGAYGYVLKGKTLTLKPVSEPCIGRKLVLTAHPLKRVG